MISKTLIHLNKAESRVHDWKHDVVVLNIQLVAGQEMAEHGKVKKMIAAIGRLAESFGAPSVD